MKFIKTALLILLLCGPAIESAHAGIHLGSAGRSGASHAFKGGFSSQKSAAISRDAADLTPKKSSFGSFGAAANAAPPSPAAPAPSSALSKDLNAATANAGALKTFDARNQAAARPAPADGLSAAGAGFSAAGTGPQGASVAGPAYAQSPMPQTVIVQRGGGFFSSPFVWFMLGQSMAGHDRERVVYERAGNPAGSDADSPGVAADNAVSLAPPAQKESFGASLLRVVLWLTIAAAIGGGILYALARRAARIAKGSAHYSLGKG
jgi:hypothetical protein